MSPKVAKLKFSKRLSTWGEKFSTFHRSASVLVLQFRVRPCHNFEIAGIRIELNVQCIHGLPTHTTKVQLIPLEHDQSQQTNSKHHYHQTLNNPTISMPPSFLKLAETIVFCRIKMEDTSAGFLKAPILDFRWQRWQWWWSSINCPALSGDFLPPGFLALIR